MSVIFEQYEERLHRLRRDPQTIRNYRNSIKSFEEFIGAARVEPEQVTPDLIEEFFAQSDRAPSTKELYLTNIGAAYRYAHRRGLIDRVPTVDVELARVPDTEPRIIPNSVLREQRDRIVSDRGWLLWHLLTYTGMRRQEVIQLPWENVKLDEETITVLGKGGKLRHVPIHPVLGEVLVEAKRKNKWVLPGRAGSHTAPSTFYETLHCISRREYTAHDYRRTVASSLYANGVDGDTIDKIMGWSPRVVRTRYYVNVAPVQLQRAILKLYANDPL